MQVEKSWSYPIESLSNAIKQSIEVMSQKIQSNDMLKETQDHFANTLDGKGLLVNITG